MVGFHLGLSSAAVSPALVVFDAFAAEPALAADSVVELPPAPDGSVCVEETEELQLARAIDKARVRSVFVCMFVFPRQRGFVGRPAYGAQAVEDAAPTRGHGGA